MKASFDDHRRRVFLSRFGGDEFIVILDAEGEQQVQAAADLVCANITDFNEKSGAAFKLEASAGYAEYDYDNPMTIPQLIAKADEKMYEIKKKKN